MSTKSLHVLSWITFLFFMGMPLAGKLNEDTKARTGKELLERYVEIWNSAEVERLDEILMPDFVFIDGQQKPVSSMAAMKQRIIATHKANHDWRLEVLDVVAGPEHGAMRFNIHGVYAPTGDRFEYVNMAMYRFVEGKIAEERLQGDSISYITDLGYRMVPPGYRMVPPPVENAALYDVEPTFPTDAQLRKELVELSALASNRAATVELESEVGCRLRLDGRELGWLPAGRSVEVRLDPGSHTLQAMSAGRAIFFQESFDLRKKEQRSIEIASPGRMIAQPRAGVSEDLTTGLMWPLQDSGDGFTWATAQAYCEDLDLAGYTDWRLPTIFELDSIYKPDSTRDFKTVNGVTLSQCCPWSSNLHGDSMAWIYVFYKGTRYLQHKTFGGSRLLALCVRDPLGRPGPTAERLSTPGTSRARCCGGTT